MILTSSELLALKLEDLGTSGLVRRTGYIEGRREARFDVRNVKSGQWFGDIIRNVGDEGVVVIVPDETEPIGLRSSPINLYLPFVPYCVDEVLETFLTEHFDANVVYDECEYYGSRAVKKETWKIGMLVIIMRWESFEVCLSDLTSSGVTVYWPVDLVEDLFIRDIFMQIEVIHWKILFACFRKYSSFCSLYYWISFNQFDYFWFINFYQFDTKISVLRTFQ